MGLIVRTIKKTVVSVSVLALVAGTAAVFGTAYLFQRSLPAYSGTAKIGGLSAPVNVLRDKYGVPHIFAQNSNDAARALGYVHASERLFQMEMQRRAGQGRLSEVLGDDMLGVDKFVRTLGLYRLSQSSYAAMSPEAQATFRAYADGVNAWLNDHRDSLPPEFLLIGDKVEPWQPADSVVWGKLMSLNLSHNYKLELLRAELVSKLPAGELPWLFPMPSPDTPVTTQPNASSSSLSQPADQRLAKLVGLDHAASNEWVIDGAHTESGKPILANDPHLSLEAPILWYLARIVTPDGSVKGVTVPGVPVVLLGQNDHVAWGLTTTGSDVEDLFVETVEPSNHQRYLTPEGSAAFEEHNETIHVKNAKDVTLIVRSTRHGPVMSDIDDEMAQLAGAGKVMALAFTGLGDKDTTSEAFLRIDKARNASELLDALKFYQTPAQNIVYADSSGSIGFINPGLVPIRKKGDGLMPADGASGDYDWIGTLPLELDPQVSNPASGYIFNANNPVVAANSPYDLGQDWEEPYRARRLQQFFDNAQKFTLQQSSDMQADHLSLVAKSFLPLLLRLEPSGAKTKEALEMLKSWDATMEKGRPEPVIFEAWLYEFNRHMLSEKTGVDMRDKGPFAAETLMSLVTQHGKEWCGTPDPDCRHLMEQSLDDALKSETERQGTDMSAWRWGRENVASLQNKFYHHLPILDKFSDLSVESSGDFYTLDRGGGFDNDVDHPFARTHGAGFRGVYDLGNPEASLFMIATGESGHIFSKHYGDLVSLWNNAKAITLTGSPEQLRMSGAEELVLEPQ